MVNVVNNKFKIRGLIIFLRKFCAFLIEKKNILNYFSKFSYITIKLTQYNNYKKFANL